MPKIEYCSRGIWLHVKQDRPDLPDGGFFRVDESTCNVQLDQFSNISVTGQCPGRAADAAPVQGPASTKFTF